MAAHDLVYKFCVYIFLIVFRNKVKNRILTKSMPGADALQQQLNLNIHRTVPTKKWNVNTIHKKGFCSFMSYTINYDCEE